MLAEQTDDHVVSRAPLHLVERTADSRDHLIDRHRELTELAVFFDEAFRFGGALTVTGERGVGKSALVNEAARLVRTARNARVACAAGIATESGVRFAALHQLMLPLSGTLSQVPERFRETLAVTLGLEHGRLPSTIQLATALLAWFRRLADSRPFLVVIDDWPNVDRASRRVLGMVARRLDATGTAMVLIHPGGTTPHVQSARTSVIELPPLSEQASTLLLDRIRLAPTVRHRVATVACGNPLILTELPRALTSAQRDGTESVPEFMALTQPLRDAFAERTDRLTTSSRELLLLAALNGDRDVPLDMLVRDRAEDVRGVEESGAARVDVRSHSLQFRHILTRWAVVESASAPERRAAHAWLASRTDSADRRALHRAEAALDLDDEAAHALVTVADSRVEQGDIEHAITALTRASELTSNPLLATSRLSQAAYLAARMAGAPARAAAILQRAHGTDHRVGSTLEEVTARAAILAASGSDIHSAQRMLIQSVTLLGEDSTPRAIEAAVSTLSFICSLADDTGGWRAYHDVVRRFSAQLPRSVVIGATTLGDPARAAEPQLREIDLIIKKTDAGGVNPASVMQLVDAGFRVGRMPHRLLGQAMQAARSGGAFATVATGLLRLAEEAFADGRLVDAEQFADECLTLCHEHGLALHAAAKSQRMLVLAVRGESSVSAPVVDALLAMAEGRFHDALDAFRVVGGPGTFPSFEHVAMWTVLDVVDACVRSGEVAEGRRHLDAAIGLGLHTISPRLRFFCGAAEALISPDQTYVESFERVITSGSSQKWPFHLARVQLAYGERLRHDREIARAREHLSDAARLFSEQGARNWADRAAAELRATGQHRHVEPHLRDQLTPQEEEVALLAASGLTNKQIGERMFLSARTVSGHLYRVFPKLGVATRAGLRDALSKREQS
jgi:DNA-binding CsgD family transcriptional regulator